VDLTFISLLQVPQNGVSRVRFEQFVNARIQHALPPSAVIERGCSIGANHAQKYLMASSDRKTCRVAIARFRMIRARFNKRSKQPLPKADHRSDIRNAPSPSSNIDEIYCVCSDAVA